MSFSYRSVFIENILNMYDMIDETNAPYYSELCELLTQQPFCFYFYIAFIEKLYPKIN